MPTLIRLIVILLVLVGIGYGIMFALVAMVKPGDEVVTVRIPARDLVPAPSRDPLVQREIDTSRPVEVPVPEPEPEPALPPQPEPEADSEVVTLEPGVE